MVDAWCLCDHVVSLVHYRNRNYHHHRHHHADHAIAGDLFWLRGFSLGGAWLMMGELMKMIVMIKKCTNSSQSCKLIESQRKNFNFNVFFFLMGHTHNLLRWTLDLLYIFSLLLIKYYDNEMFTVSNNIDGKVCPPCCFCSADAKLFKTASTVMIILTIIRTHVMFF